MCLCDNDDDGAQYQLNRMLFAFMSQQIGVQEWAGELDHWQPAPI